MLLIIGLLAANLVLTIIHWNGRQKHGPKSSPKELIIEKLEFNESQIAEYDILISSHREKIQVEESEIKRLKSELFELLNYPSESISDSLSSEIAEHIKNIETAHYNHFKEIRSLCSKDQIDNFNDLIEELPRLFLPPPPKRMEK